MAISSNAMTLAQYALISNNPLIMKVVYSLREAGAIWTDIPFINKKTLRVAGARWTGNLPTVGWVKLNASPAVVTGDPTPFEEQAFMLRNLIEVDHALVEDTNQIMDPRASRLGAYLRSAAYDFNDKFINNSHVTGDSNAIAGIRARLDDPTTYGTLTGNKIDAGGAVITTAATAAQANAFFDWLDQLLWALDSPEGDGVVLYMNDTMIRRIPFLLRTMGANGGLNQARDQFDRVISMYKGAVIKDAGVKADQTTRIITSTETAAGANGSSTYTSIYGVRYGEDFVTGWQFEPLKAEDLGRDPTDGVVYRTFIEWIGGLVVPNQRAIARLYDLKVS